MKPFSPYVLCEKPFTLSPQESQNLFTLAQEKGLFIMEAQKVLFLPVIQKIKELIEDGVLVLFVNSRPFSINREREN